MDRPVSGLRSLLAAMEPVLHDGAHVWCVVPYDTDISGWAPVATVAEPEGLTVILPEGVAIKAGLPIRFRAAWITLTVHSDLQAVGFTAAVAGALGQAGISCNLVAGAFHDHLFVPAERAQEAMAALRDLQNCHRR